MYIILTVIFSTIHSLSHNASPKNKTKKKAFGWHTKRQYLFYFLISSSTESLLLEDITENINIILCIPSVPRFRKRSSEWKKRNGPPYVGFTYVSGGKSIYLSQNNMWTYKFPISNVLISLWVPKAWRLLLSVKTKVLLLPVPFPPAIVLLKENLKQNMMSLFPCCKTVSIDGFHSISKHALYHH